MSHPHAMGQPASKEAAATMVPLVQQQLRHHLLMELERSGQTPKSLANWVNMPPQALMKVINAEGVLEWSLYREILTACGSTQERQVAIRRLWANCRQHLAQLAAQGTFPPQRSYLELEDSELLVNTPAEFAQLLNKILKRAGLTCGQIATKTSIPRSQAYSLVSSKRVTLPVKLQQVIEFVAACGLDPHQVEAVARQWSKLAEGKNGPNEPTTAVDAPPGEKTVPILVPVPDFTPGLEPAPPPATGAVPTVNPNLGAAPALGEMVQFHTSGLRRTWAVIATFGAVVGLCVAALTTVLVVVIDRWGFFAPAALMAVLGSCVFALLGMALPRRPRKVNDSIGRALPTTTTTTTVGNKITVAELLARQDQDRPPIPSPRRRSTPFIEDISEVNASED